MAERSSVCNFGWKAPEFNLPSTEGRQLSLSSIAGENGTLVMFICNHCPYVHAVIDRLNAEVSALEEFGIGAAAICSNDAVNYPDDSFPNMVKFAKDNGFRFPYLHDEDQTVARAYDAICTPDFFGLNSKNELQYRGRLDSAGKSGRSGNTRRELYEAMVEISKSGKGPERQVPLMGCSIKWK